MVGHSPLACRRQAPLTKLAMIQTRFAPLITNTLQSFILLLSTFLPTLPAATDSSPMPRPLRSRKAAPASASAPASAGQVASAAARTKTTKPRLAPAAAKKGSRTATTTAANAAATAPKPSRPTRARPAQPTMPSSPPLAPVTTRTSHPANVKMSVVVEVAATQESTATASGDAAAVPPPLPPSKKKKKKKEARLVPGSNIKKNAKSTRRTAKSPSPFVEESEEDAGQRLELALGQQDKQHVREVTPSTLIPSTPATRRPYSSAVVSGVEKDYSSPAQSSNAENYSPQRRLLPALASSPPVRQSTPKGGDLNLQIIDFSSDAGYTPRKKPGSAERPRLQDLDAKTLEPIGVGDDDDDGDDDYFRLPSPTPRRRRGRPSDYLFADQDGEEDEGEGEQVEALDEAVVVPLTLPSPVRRPEGGRGFMVAGGEFTIYSDPKSGSATPVPGPPASNYDDDPIMRPPGSSSPPRKRRSSEAALDSEAELTARETTPSPKRTRRRRGVAAASKTADPAELPTNAIRNTLLPKRRSKARRAVREAASLDERSARTTTTRKKTAAAAKTPARPAGKGKAAVSSAAKARSARTPVVKTYTKKAPDHNTDDLERSPEPTPLPSSSSGNSGGSGGGSSGGDSGVTVEVADGVLHREGVKKLKEMKKKFEDVDQWEMEFEDVSQPTSDLVGAND